MGDAIVDYIKNSRPQCDTRHLFVRSRAPYLQFHHPSSVSTIVRRAIDTAGIKTKTKGGHLLRYTMAHDSLCHDATLHEVRELLRHSTIDTSALYIKFDINELRNMATPWPTSATLGGVK